MSWKLPIKTDWMDKQMKHEPSREYAQEIYWMVKFGRKNYREACEIGNAWGISTLAILIAGKGNLTTVDKSDPAVAVAEVTANGLMGRTKFVSEPSDKFWQKNANKYDLIYIDGSHLYADIKNDLYQAWECLEDKGLMFWDDYNHPKNIENDPSNGQAEYGIALASLEFMHDKKINFIHTDRLLGAIK